MWGRLMRAADSLILGGLPIGFAHRVKLVKPVAAGHPVTWGSVEAQDSEDASDEASESQLYCGFGRDGLRE